MIIETSSPAPQLTFGLTKPGDVFVSTGGSVWIRVGGGTVSSALKLSDGKISTGWEQLDTVLKLFPSDTVFVPKS